jgi:hypothetical protein
MAGKAGRAGGAGTSGAGTSGQGGTAGEGTGGKGGSGGMAGGEEAGGTGGSGATGGGGGKGGSGGKGGAGGTTGGTGAETGGGQGGAGEGGIGGEHTTGGTSGKGGSSGSAGTSGTTGIGGTAGTAGTAGSGGTIGTGGTLGGPGGEGGIGGEGGFGGEGGAGPNALNLFFSEYVENTGTNPRALEIINKSGASVDISACSIGIFNNASATVSRTITLSGTVANNDVFVICSAAIGTACDQTSANLVFDGNDAISLRCNGTRVDIIGQNTGTSPGTEWGDATVGTADQTLRRKCSVTHGDTNGTDAFVPSVEWVSVGTGVTSGLGSATCG